MKSDYPSLLLCSRWTSEHTSELKAALRNENQENVFNPSIVSLGHRDYVAYRALGPQGGKPFHAFLMCRERGARGRHTTSLTELAADYGIAQVADPKLVVLGGQLHVTFNTGYSTVQNDLYLMQLTPSVGAPLRCVLADRQRVEKNWGFFQDDEGLAALYSLSPLIVIRAVARSSTPPELRFSAGTSRVLGQRISRLTQGSQPIVRDGRLLLIAHEKRQIRRRRCYWGRPVQIVDPTSASAHLDLGATRLLHSIRATKPVPSRRRHNPNLLFATYFAGATVIGDKATVSYGVNDLECGFAEVPIVRLWR